MGEKSRGNYEKILGAFVMSITEGKTHSFTEMTETPELT